MICVVCEKEIPEGKNVGPKHRTDRGYCESCYLPGEQLITAILPWIHIYPQMKRTLMNCLDAVQERNQILEYLQRAAAGNEIAIESIQAAFLLGVMGHSVDAVAGF